MTLLRGPADADEGEAPTRADQLEDTTMGKSPAVDDPRLGRGVDAASDEPDALDARRTTPRSRPERPAETGPNADGGEGYQPARAGSIPWPIAAVAGLCVLALVLALIALQQRSQLQRDRSQTTQLKQVSGQLVGALTTYDYQHLPDWQKAVLTHATGSFRNGFNDRFSSVEKLLTATHNRATSTVQGIYVGDVQGGRASTVVIVNVTVTGLSGTRQFGSYDKLSVLKVNGQWQVDDIETLNFDSTTGSASPAPAPTTPSTASK
jgi:hypothetical protein